MVLYVFADPFCYCKQFLAASSPVWVESGKGTITALLVGVIKPEARPQPQRFSSREPGENGMTQKLIPQEGETGGSGVPPWRKMKVINQNQQLMDDLGANATPAIYYMNKDKIFATGCGFTEKAQLDARALTNAEV